MRVEASHFRKRRSRRLRSFQPQLHAQPRRLHASASAHLQHRRATITALPRWWLPNREASALRRANRVLTLVIAPRWLSRSLLRRLPLNAGCLLWTGPTMRDGTAAIRIDGRERAVHRVVWELVHGPLPYGAVVQRRCGQRACVAIPHLDVRARAGRVASAYPSRSERRRDVRPPPLEPHKPQRPPVAWRRRQFTETTNGQ
jgi:hypothetical protein